MNKTVSKIDKLIGEFEAIKDGAVVNPKTGKIWKDKDGKILYYDNQKRRKENEYILSTNRENILKQNQKDERV